MCKEIYDWGDEVVLRRHKEDQGIAYDAFNVFNVFWNKHKKVKEYIDNIWDVMKTDLESSYPYSCEKDVYLKSYVLLYFETQSVLVLQRKLVFTHEAFNATKTKHTIQNNKYN